MPLFREYEQLVLAYRFQGAAAPSGFEVRLFNDTPEFTDTLSTLQNELSGYGYTPQPLGLNDIDWPLLNQDANGIWVLTSKELIYQAVGGDWPQAKTWVLLTTDATPKLIAWGGDGTTLTSGQRLGLTISLKRQAQASDAQTPHTKGIIEDVFSMGALMGAEAEAKYLPDDNDLFPYVDTETAQMQIKKVPWGALKSIAPIVIAPNGSRWVVNIDNNGNLGASSL